MQFGNVAVERHLLEMTYNGRCWISEMRTFKDPVTGKTKTELVEVVSNQSCALSQTQLKASEQSETTSDIRYDAKLFLPPELILLSGSRVRVEQDGMNIHFISAGEPFKYPTHQEVMLNRSDKS